MKRPYQVTSIVVLCIAAFLAKGSLELRYYTPLGPGPGFFPLWLSILLAILAIAMLSQATFGKSEAMPKEFFAGRKGYLRIGTVVAALIAVIALMEPIGFCLVMLGFYLFLLSALGRQRVLVTGLIALAGSVGLYYVFVHWLKVALPIGLFGV